MILNKKDSYDIKGVIFDLDATLVDSEPIWFLSDKRLLNEYGIELTEEMKLKYIGKSIDDMLDDLINNHGLKGDRDEIYYKKNSYFVEEAQTKIKLFDEMVPILKNIEKNDIPMSIASGTAKNIIMNVVDILKIKDKFQNIVSAEEVERGKPYPDIFIETAKRMNIEPKNILVFEDSIHGVKSAIAAGMNCVAIPYTDGDKNNDDFNIADLIFSKGMNEVNWIIIEKTFLT